MGKTFFKYDLFNVRENSFELVGVTLDEISTYTSIPKSSITRYANQDHIYKKKYKFYRELSSEGQKKDSESIPPKLKIDWDKICFKLNPMAERFSVGAKR